MPTGRVRPGVAVSAVACKVPSYADRAEKGITESEFGLVEERARATTDNSNNLLS